MDKWRSEFKVFHGGLMRCCLATLGTFMAEQAAGPPQEGDTLQCDYCCGNGGMIFSEGAWRWNRPKDLP